MRVASATVRPSTNGTVTLRPSAAEVAEGVGRGAVVGMDSGGGNGSDGVRLGGDCHTSTAAITASTTVQDLASRVLLHVLVAGPSHPGSLSITS